MTRLKRRNLIPAWFLFIRSRHFQGTTESYDWQVIRKAEVTWVQTQCYRNGPRWWRGCNSSSRCRRRNNVRRISGRTGWGQKDTHQQNQTKSKHVWVVFQNYLSITFPVQTGSFKNKLQSSSTRSPQLPDICPLHLWEGVRKAYTATRWFFGKTLCLHLVNYIVDFFSPKYQKKNINLNTIQ